MTDADYWMAVVGYARPSELLAEHGDATGSWLKGAVAEAIRAGLDADAEAVLANLLEQVEKAQ